MEAYAAHTVDALFMCIVFAELFDEDGLPVQPPGTTTDINMDTTKKTTPLLKGEGDDAHKGGGTHKDGAYKDDTQPPPAEDVFAEDDDDDAETEFWSDMDGSDGESEYLSVGTSSVASMAQSYSSAGGKSGKSSGGLLTKVKSLMGGPGMWCMDVCVACMCCQVRVCVCAACLLCVFVYFCCLQ